MTFERSQWGQANRAIFYNVDWIIYTEGGAGDGEPARSFDSLFWSGVFSSLCPNVRFRAIPKGGKGQLLPLAAQVADAGIERVIVALDRDYDVWHNRLIIHPRVLYTRGYSFENDVLDKEYIEDLFCYAFPDVVDFDVGAYINSWVDDFIRCWRWPLKIDAFAGANGVAGFDRERPQKYFLSNAYGAEPKTCTDRLNAEVNRMIAEAATRAFPQNGLPKISYHDVIGHIWEVFVFKTLSCLSTRFTKSGKLSYDAMRALAISRFQVRLMLNERGDLLAGYYNAVVAKAIS